MNWNVLKIITCIILFFLLVGCGKTIAVEGTWYSVTNDGMFSFNKGIITRSGFNVGQYEVNDDFIIMSTIDTGKNLKLYVTEKYDVVVLASKKEGSGIIYFCKGLQNTKKIRDSIKKEEELLKAKLREEKLAKEKKLKEEKLREEKLAKESNERLRIESGKMQFSLLGTWIPKSSVNEIAEVSFMNGFNYYKVVYKYKSGRKEIYDISSFAASSFEGSESPLMWIYVLGTNGEEKKPLCKVFFEKYPGDVLTIDTVGELVRKQ